MLLKNQMFIEKTIKKVMVFSRFLFIFINKQQKCNDRIHKKNVLGF